GVAAGLGGGVGVFYLTEDFRFSEHLRIDAGGDLEEMADGFRAIEAEAALLEFRRIDELLGAERCLHACRGAAVGGDTVEFDAIAGVEQGELAQALDGGELGGEGAGGVGAERKTLAKSERRGVVR